MANETTANNAANSTQAVEDATARVQAFWQQRVEQQVAAFDAAVEQMTALQHKGREQLMTTVDEVTGEMNRLFKAQLDYMTQMQAQFQAMTLDTMRRSADLGR